MSFISTFTSRIPQILMNIWTSGIFQTGRNSFTWSGKRSENQNFSQVPQWCQWSWSTDPLFSHKSGHTTSWTDTMFAQLGEIRHTTVAEKYFKLSELSFFPQYFSLCKDECVFCNTIFYFSKCQIMCWDGQKFHSGFSVTSYGKTQMNFLAKPILLQCFIWKHSNDLKNCVYSVTKI